MTTPYKLAKKIVECFRAATGVYPEVYALGRREHLVFQAAIISSVCNNQQLPLSEAEEIVDWLFSTQVSDTWVPSSAHIVLSPKFIRLFRERSTARISPPSEAIREELRTRGETAPLGRPK